MLVTLLPVIIIAMVLLTTISAVSSSNIVNEQTSEKMAATLDAEAGTIEDYLGVVQSMAMTISRTVGTTYTKMELSQYEDMLSAASMFFYRYHRLPKVSNVYRYLHRIWHRVTLPLIL